MVGERQEEVFRGAHLNPGSEDMVDLAFWLIGGVGEGFGGSFESGGRQRHFTAADIEVPDDEPRGFL